MQDSFWERIQRVRNAELGILWKTFVIDSTNVFLLNAIPTVVSVTTFLTFILMGNTLTAAKVCVLCKPRAAQTLGLCKTCYLAAVSVAFFTTFILMRKTLTADKVGFAAQSTSAFQI